jgi:hypothetical protein
MYTHIVHLRSGVPIKVPSRNLPELSEELLLYIEKPDGEKYTFVIDAVAYITTKAGG